MQSPSLKFYKHVRAVLIERGTTLNAWCIENRINRQTATHALSGTRSGAKSMAIVSLIAGELNIKIESASK